MVLSYCPEIHEYRVQYDNEDGIQSYTLLDDLEADEDLLII